MSYDKRMNLWDNWRFKAWRPFVCLVLGHDVTCYKIVCTHPKPNWWTYICHCCMSMTDHAAPCGQCSNGCGKEGESWRQKARRRRYARMLNYKD